MFGRRAPSGGIVVARIEAEVLRLILRRFRTFHDDRFDGFFQQLRVMNIRTFDRDPQCSTFLIANYAAFGTVFRPIGGIWADFIPPKRALAMAPSALCHSQPTPPASSHSSIKTAMSFAMIPFLFQR